MSSTPWLAVVAIALTPACAKPLETDTIEQGILCAAIVCGNSPYVELAPVPVLDETGVTPAAVGNWRIVKFEGPLGAPLHLDVLGFHLRGFTAGNALVHKSSLVGAKITIDHGTDEQWVIRIDAYHDTLRYFELGNDNTKIDSYQMSWTKVGSRHPPVNLCQIPDENSTTQFDALVFQGDLYDPTTGRVTQIGPGTSPWFNIACVGDGLAKMVLTRHVSAAADLAHPSDKDMRTAVLNGIRANYCGDGTAWTKLGTPLDWQNSGGWNVLEPETLTHGRLEAVWDENGAVCLSSPRLYDLAEIPCTTLAGGWVPKCTRDQQANWQNYGTFVTYLPPP